MGVLRWLTINKSTRKAYEAVEFVARSGAKLDADYLIENGVLHVAYRGVSMSVAAGVNEIANAFLKDNLMRSITGEIDAPPRTDVGPSGPPTGP